MTKNNRLTLQIAIFAKSDPLPVAPNQNIISCGNHWVVVCYWIKQSPLLSSQLHILPLLMRTICILVPYSI